MIRNENSIEHEIARRQLAMWTRPTKRHPYPVCHILNFVILNNPPSKEDWNGVLDQKIYESVEFQWKSDIDQICKASW